MKYSSSTARPRSVLVIVGGLTAWIGIIGGVFVTVPEYHRALTMNDEPVDMTWQELLDRGLSDNAYVRLVDVELDQSEPLGFFEEMLRDIDPVAPAEDQLEAFELAAENISFGDFAESIMQPIKVYPKGEDPSEFAARIVVPQSTWALNSAYRQIEESGTLTGRFTPTRTAGSEMDLTTLILGHVADAVEEAAMQVHVGPQDEDDQDDRNDGGNAAGPNRGPAEPVLRKAGQGADGPTYVFEPVDTMLSEAEVCQWFWFSGLAVAVGLVICGSGGPSLSCCVFFQALAVLSLLGYPLRYGRAGKTTRVVYAAAGVMLIGYGFQKMCVEGQFGHVHGNVLLASIGFVAGAVGCGALVGSCTSVVAGRLNIRLESKSIKGNDEPKTNLTNACRVEPTKKDFGPRYVEPNLVNDYNQRFDASMERIAESLAMVGFGEPEPVVWQDGEESSPALIALGCQEMVVADVDQSDGEATARLVSVLHDGLAIITLSSNVRSQKKLRLGTNGLYAVADCDDPTEMLSTHLGQAVSMAEKRNTAVVQIEPMEATDVALFGRRVLVDVRGQYGEENAEVDSQQYGRFCFPATPIEQPAAV